MLIIGNYILNLKFGGMDVPLSPQMMESIAVTMDADRLMPTFRITARDATGILGEILPYDKNLNKLI